MTTKQRGVMIGNIIAHLRLMASTENKQFLDGDVFLSLAFKSNTELLRIARLCGVVKRRATTRNI